MNKKKKYILINILKSLFVSRERHLLWLHINYYISKRIQAADKKWLSYSSTDLVFQIKLYYYYYFNILLNKKTVFREMPCLWVHNKKCICYYRNINKSHKSGKRIVFYLSALRYIGDYCFYSIKLNYWQTLCFLGCWVQKWPPFLPAAYRLFFIFVKQ